MHSGTRCCENIVGVQLLEGINFKVKSNCTKIQKKYSGNEISSLEVQVHAKNNFQLVVNIKIKKPLYHSNNVTYKVFLLQQFYMYFHSCLQYVYKFLFNRQIFYIILFHTEFVFPFHASHRILTQRYMFLCLKVFYLLSHFCNKKVHLN